MSESLTIEQSLLLELKRIQEEIEENRFGGFEPASLAWLVLVPIWTESLVKTVRFPTGDLSLDDFLGKAQKMGLCTLRTEQEFREEKTYQFWVPKESLESLLDYLKKAMGPRWLQKQAFEIAIQISKNLKGDIYVPPETHRWVDLALTLKAGLEEANDFLDQKNLELVGSGRTGEAIEWVNTGLQLAGAMEGNLRNTLLAGKKRIQLSYRAKHDQYYLRDYLEIADQVKALESLMSSDGKPWALHYVGMGGVGKTMLMRYISHHYRDQYITARVDFDHLSPEYPRRRPGQLLIYFAEELRMFSGSSPQQVGLFVSLRRKVDALHNRLAEMEQSAAQGGDPIDIDRVIDSPEYDSILNDFAGILALMALPVVLILDTCEELIKLRPIDGKLKQLETTFKILEKLKDKEPGLRVVFAGRRLLAKEGFDWKAGPERTEFLPDKVDYLALHPIRGFTREQAVRFLREKKELTLDPDFETAILEASTEIGDPIDLEYGYQPDWDLERYNPFDLSLYADWIKEDKTVTLEQIQSGETDPYIEYRIIDRLEEDLRHLIPGVAQLGRFDLEMLRPVFNNLDDTVIQQLFHKLGDQEWIDHETNPTGGTEIYLQVEPNLLTRLRRYYQAESHQGAYNRAGNLLGPHLAELALGRNLSAVNEDLVGPALRLLSPEAVTQFWDSLEHRFVERGEWNRLKDLLDKLPGGKGSVEEPNHPAHAQYRATQYAIQLHTPDSQNANLAAWMDIALTIADTHNSFQSWLYTRSILGMASNIQLKPDPNEIDDLINILLSFPEIDHLLPDIDVEEKDYYRIQLSASLCASLDRVLQYRFETAPRRLKANEGRFLSAVIGWGLDPGHPKAWMTEGEVYLAVPEDWDLEGVSKSDMHFPPQVSLFALLLAARAGKIINYPDRDLILERIHTLLGTWKIQPEPNQFLDWIPPVSMVDYVRLELLRLSPPVFQSTTWNRVNKTLQQQEEPIWCEMFNHDGLEIWLQDALSRTGKISAERLVSRILQLRMADRLNIDDKLLAELEAYQVPQAGNAQARAAHLSVPPLAVTLAQGWSALNNPKRAINLLRNVGRKLRGAGKENLENELRRAQLVIGRQARSILEGNDIYGNLALSVAYEDNAVAWPLNTLVGVDSTGGPMDIAIDTGSPGKPQRATYPVTVFSPQQGKFISDRRLALWWRCQSTLDSYRQRLILESFYGLAKERYIFAPEEAPNREAFELSLCMVEYNHMCQANFPEFPSLPSENLSLAVDTNPDDLPARPYIEDLLEMSPWFTEDDLRLLVQASQIWRPDVNLIEILEHSASRFGCRRVAQIVLEEAELLALRHPIRTLKLLTLAYDLFQSASDPLNELKTTILRVITSAHGGDLEASRDWFERFLQKTYEDWQQVSHPQNLPSWAELTWTMTLETVTNPKWENSGLAGWWHRLIVCILWHWQPDINERERDRIQRWLDDFYKYSQPVELDRAIQYHEESPKLTRDTTSKTSDWIFTVIGLSFGLGILVGGYFLLGWVIRRFIWSDGIRWYWQLLIYIGIWILGAYLPERINLKGLFFSLSRVRFDIHKEIEDPDAEDGFRIDLYQRVLRWFLFIPRGFKDVEPTSYQVPSIGLDAYQSEARKFPSALVELISGWSKMLPPHHMAIQINPDAQSRQVPWEAMLNFNSRLPDDDSAPSRDKSAIADLRPNALQFYRVSPELPTRVISLRMAVRIRNQVVVLSNPAWQSLVEEGWGRIQTRFLEQIVGGLPQETEHMSRVLHLVGTPFGSPENILLALGDTQFNEQMMAQQSFNNQSDYRNTIAPGDLYTRLYSLIVLQAEPTATKIRLASEREKMGLLQAFASDLLRLGARAVIVLPPLEPKLAVQVLAGIRKRLPLFGFPRLRRLLRMVISAKKVLRYAKNASTSADILDELAQDITLYYSGPFKEAHHQLSEPGSKSAV